MSFLYIDELDLVHLEYAHEVIIMAIVKYNVEKSDLIEELLPDFTNEGTSECDGDNIVWYVDLPQSEIELLKANGFNVY